MKKFIVLICSIISFTATAQNSHLVTKDGTKIIIDDNEVDVVLIDKRVSYKLPGKKWQKYVKFNDLDYLIYGSSKLKSVNLNNDKKATVLNVLAEGKEKSLLALVYTITTKHGRMTSSNTYYYYVIVDNKNSVIASASFTASDREKNVEIKSLAVSRIKEHFSDCPDVVSGLESSEGGIEAFLAKRVYTICN